MMHFMHSDKEQEDAITWIVRLIAISDELVDILNKTNLFLSRVTTKLC